MSTLCIPLPYYDPSYNLFSNRAVSDDANILQSHIAEIKQDFDTSVELGGKKIKITQALLNLFEECAHPDWDGYGAKAIDKESYYESFRFIQYLPVSLPGPEVTIEPDGEVAFEWFNGKRRMFSISVGGNGELSYAGLFGCNKTHGTEFFGDELPKTILESIQRVFD